jgi:adenylylsulfate kinase
MTTYKDAHHRSILKALSWRVVATFATMSIVFAFTRKAVLSVGVGAVEVVIKLILYYFHERIWGILGIGRKEHPLSSLPVKKALEEEDMEVIKKKLKELGYIDED